MLHAEFSKVEHLYDATIRMNSAPTNGFEPAVGTRTTIRSVPNFEILPKEELLYNGEEKILTRQIGARSSEYMKNATAQGNVLTIYQFGNPGMMHGPERLTEMSMTWSSGMWTIAASQYFCDKLFLIGFEEQDRSYGDLLYHYWDASVSRDDFYEESARTHAGHNFGYEHELLMNVSLNTGHSGRAVILELSWKKFAEHLIPSNMSSRFTNDIRDFEV